MKRRKIQAVCAHLGCDEASVVDAAEKVAREAREARVLITAAEAALTKTEAERVALVAELAAASGLLEVRDDEALAASQVVARIGNELADARQQRAVLDAALDDAKAALAHEQHAGAALAAQVNELGAALAGANARVAEVQRELAAREAQAEAADGHANALAAARMQLEAELAAARVQNETLEATIARVHAEITAQHQQSALAVAGAIADAVGLVAVLTDAVMCFRQMLALPPAERARVHAAAGSVVDVARAWLADVGVEINEPGEHLLAMEDEAARGDTGAQDESEDHVSSVGATQAEAGDDVSAGEPTAG